MRFQAQCCELEQLRLVDGTVTDDSDAFAFGGRVVYKNIFNERKYVEAYLLPDVQKVRARCECSPFRESSAGVFFFSRDVRPAWTVVEDIQTALPHGNTLTSTAIIELYTAREPQPFQSSTIARFFRLSLCSLLFFLKNAILWPEKCSAELVQVVCLFVRLVVYLLLFLRNCARTRVGRRVIRFFSRVCYLYKQDSSMSFCFVIVYRHTTYLCPRTV